VAGSEAILDGLPVVREAFPRTVRLVSTARLRRSVLLALVGEDDLEALAEIEGATSARLQAEHRGTGTIDARELVHGVPHASFINASFAYAKPRELNRFNGPGRGAWYAALDVATCLAEVAYHMAEFLARAGSFEATVEYAEMHASLAGEYLDLRAAPGHRCLDPDPSVGYPAGNAVADAARVRGLNGIIYPSVRHPGGTCFVALWPHAVQSVAMGDGYRLVWNGTPKPTISRIQG
jgi:RES domain-containing protein